MVTIFTDIAKEVDLLIDHFQNLDEECFMLAPTSKVNQKPDSRTYSDYESINECLEGICKIYEEHLKRTQPNSPSITYDISQLFDFIDQLVDLSCLVYRKDGNYDPHNKDWLKEKIYVMLRKQAGH